MPGHSLAEAGGGVSNTLLISNGCVSYFTHRRVQTGF